MAAIPRPCAEDIPSLEEQEVLRRELRRQMEKLLSRRKVGEPVHVVNPEDNKNEADQVARLMEQNAAISLCNQTTHQLKKISAAVRRMDEGLFGVCAQCEGTIGKARLLANPASVLCLHCQSRADLSGWLSFCSPREYSHLLRSG